MTAEETPTRSSAGTLTADLSAGLVVFLVALPLCLGVALASNAPLFSGIVAGIVGGLVVGAISHSHTSVSGPAAGLTAVVAAQIASLGSFEAFLLAVTFAGMMQIALGIAGAGSIADFVPSSVIRGLLGAIGLILILKQIPHLFGYDADPVGEMQFFQPDQENTFSELLHLFARIHGGAAAIGLFCLALLITWDRVKVLKASPVPSALVAVLVGVVGNMALTRFGAGWAIEASHLVQVPIASDLPEFLGFLKSPDWTSLANPKVYAAAITICLVASLETLLNLEAVDKLDPQRRESPPNRELLAQGVGNMVSGLIGGLPVTSVIVRSSVNINSGGKTKLATLVHGMLLLLCVGLLPTWLNLIPLSALAAVLITTGYKLANPKLFKQMWHAGFHQFLPFIVTIGAILLTDLLVGIVIGLAFSILFILRSNLSRPLHRTLEKHIAGDVLHIELANQVSFLNRVALRNALAKAPRGGHVLLDARGTDYIDGDILTVIHEFETETAPARGVQVSLIGFKAHYKQIEDRVQFADYTTRALQEKLTPDQVIEILRAGNQRFQTGEILTRITHLRQGVGDRRHPLAVVLSGSSSRTPVEMIFDVGPGDVFCTRITGNAAVPSTLGSLEYACAGAGAKVIVVLGHTGNQAVRLAVESLVQPGATSVNGECLNLIPILRDIQESVDPSWRMDWSSVEEKVRLGRIDQVSRAHVQRTLQRIREQSPVLAKLAHEGRLKLIGGMYDIPSGAIDFFE